MCGKRNFAPDIIPHYTNKPHERHTKKHNTHKTFTHKTSYTGQYKTPRRSSAKTKLVIIVIVMVLIGILPGVVSLFAEMLEPSNMKDLPADLNVGDEMEVPADTQDLRELVDEPLQAVLPDGTSFQLTLGVNAPDDYELALSGEQGVYIERGNCGFQLNGPDETITGFINTLTEYNSYTLYLSPETTSFNASSYKVNIPEKLSGRMNTGESLWLILYLPREEGPVILQDLDNTGLFGCEYIEFADV